MLTCFDPIEEPPREPVRMIANKGGLVFATFVCVGPDLIGKTCYSTLIHQSFHQDY